MKPKPAIKWIYITAPNRVDPDILPDVVRRMKSLGPPVIRAIPLADKRVDHWLALEGSHRIAAAKKLDMAVIIRPMKLNQRIRHDVEDVSPKRTTVKKVADSLNESGHSIKYRVAALILY